MKEDVMSRAELHDLLIGLAIDRELQEDGRVDPRAAFFEYDVTEAELAFAVSILRRWDMVTDGLDLPSTTVFDPATGTFVLRKTGPTGERRPTAVPHSIVVITKDVVGPVQFDAMVARRRAGYAAYRARIAELMADELD
jgi:hypothetical protein